MIEPLPEQATETLEAKRVRKALAAEFGDAGWLATCWLEVDEPGLKISLLPGQRNVAEPLQRRIVGIACAAGFNIKWATFHEQSRRAA